MGAMENAVDVVVDGGFDIPVEAFERIGGGLKIGVRSDGFGSGVGDGLSDEVDMDNDRGVVPKILVGGRRGDAANDARLWSWAGWIGNKSFFFTVVIANGEIASIMA